jgi:hypothetical protein
MLGLDAAGKTSMIPGPYSRTRSRLANIPASVLVGHTLDVESDGGDGSHVLVAEFKFVKNCWQEVYKYLR